jgi:hypothetical protein
VGNPEETVHLEDLDEDRIVLFKLIFNERNGRAWTSSASGYLASFNECVDGLTSSTKCRNILD